MRFVVVVVVVVVAGGQGDARLVYHRRVQHGLYETDGRHRQERATSRQGEYLLVQGRAHGGGGEGPGPPLGPEKHYIFRVSYVKLRNLDF